jgi:SAM-dependent methyltransferase
MTRQGTAPEARYWDGIAQAWRRADLHKLWRAHSDAINMTLLVRWLPTDRVGHLLKTDLFDEGVGQGLLPLLASRARRVVGIDISALAFHIDRWHDGGLQMVRADVRRLPFASEAFDVIVSNSTLDHFTSSHEIAASLRELRRVLRVGGQLLLTLDNLANPVIVLRNTLPFPLLNRLGLVPYYVGATYSPKGLRRILRQVGFEVLEIDAIMHCPRVFAVAIARLLQRLVGPRTQSGFLRCLMAFERLRYWPTRFLTGHFIAIKAIKRSGCVDDDAGSVT